MNKTSSELRYSDMKMSWHQKVTLRLSRILWLVCFIAGMVVDKHAHTPGFRQLPYAIILYAVELYALVGAIAYPLRANFPFAESLVSVLGVIVGAGISRVLFGDGLPTGALVLTIILGVITVYLFFNPNKAEPKVRRLLLPVVYIILLLLNTISTFD